MRAIENQIILSYLYKRASISNTPISVVIELLTKCNLKCEHCYLPEHINYGMDFKKIKSILYDLKRLGTVNILLTGGEIFLRKDIFEIIELCRSLYMRVTLLTNATLLNEDKIKKLQKLHITEVSTSLFSLDNDIHNNITKGDDSLYNVLRNLDILKKTDIKVKVKMPLMKKNFKCLESVWRYSKDNNFEFLASPIIFPQNDGNSKPKQLRLEDNIELSETIKKLDKITGYKKSYAHNENVPCMALSYAMSIDCDGNVFPCNSLFYKVGNVYEESIEEIWLNSKKLRYIKDIQNKDLKQCIGCVHKKDCQRCPSMALFDGDILGCDTYSKKIAKIRESM